MKFYWKTENRGRRLENNIKADLIEIRREEVEWVNLSQYWVHFKVLVKTMIVVFHKMSDY